MIGELGVAARPVRQLTAERLVGDLRKEALRRLLDGDEAGDELWRGEDLRPAPLDAGNARHILETWPFAQSLPRRTIGTVRRPSSASSSNAPLSASTLTEMNGTPCLVRNSFILRQLVQPGCQ